MGGEWRIGKGEGKNDLTHPGKGEGKNDLTHPGRKFLATPLSSTHGYLIETQKTQSRTDRSYSRHTQS